MEIEEKSAGNVEILSLNDRLDAIVDSKKMNLTYVNAGHNPPLLLWETSGEIILLNYI